MRKPDGYASKGISGWFVDFDEYEHRVISVYPERFSHHGNEVKPVCLVPPDLLDWVDKVQEALSLDAKYADDRLVQTEAEARLSELDKIMGRK